MPDRPVNDIPCLSCGQGHLLLPGESWQPMTCEACGQSGLACAPTAQEGLCRDCWVESGILEENDHNEEEDEHG